MSAETGNQAGLKGSVRRVASFSLRTAKRVAKKVLGYVPPPTSRLTGTLARDGGRPVRDTRFRPWPEYPRCGFWEYVFRVAPTFRRIFRANLEGLPGELAAEFNKRWAEFCGARYAILTPHGTDALRIALAATLDLDGLEHGGEVIIPNLSFIASGNAALDRRLGVVLVDVDPATLNLDPAQVEEAIIPGRTRAIMPVHLFGQPADMVALRDIARRHSLLIIEDACQAHGAIHELGRAGTLGDAAAFSFQSAKNLCSGEGGVLTTDDPHIFERAYSIYNVGRARVGGLRWGHNSVGWNIRPTEYIAAALLHRLRTLEAEQQTRHIRFLELRNLLADVRCVEPLGLGPGVRRHALHMFVMRYRPEHCGGLVVDDFLAAMQAEGIPIAPAYRMTLAQQPAYQRLAEEHPNYLRVLPTPVADQAVKELIYIPHRVFLGSEADMAEIAAAFRKVQAHYASSIEPVGRPAKQQVVASASVAESQALLPSKLQKTSVLRLGIIGVGSQGRTHARAIGENPRLALVGVADSRLETGQEAARTFNCKCYPRPEDLLHSGEIDAVIIATPHWFHMEWAAAALRAGLHVACEKPLTVTVGEADELLRVAADSPGILAAIHQTRFAPAYQYAKNLLDSGALGEVYRCSMLESAWRTQAYYRSNSWRGTWKGEGGGVLLNQGPHLLDRYAWLCGMPSTVSARCDTAVHQIEVEDTASALLHHASGAHGYIHLNTVECPPASWTNIACDRGRVIIENNKVSVTILRESIREKTASAKDVWADLAGESRVMEFGESLAAQLNAFYEDLLQAIQDNGTVACSGEEARNAVELANAMILSSELERPVTLPLDREEYAQLIARKSESQTVARAQLSGS